MKENISNIEDLMYDIISLLHNLKVPMAFKGALILKMHIRQTLSGASRFTQDIDANWIGGRISDQEILTKINDCLKTYKKIKLTAKMKRSSGTNRSVGFVVYHGDFPVFNIDISLSGNQMYSDFLMPNGTIITAVTKENIYIDKCCAISGNKIFRRIKDFFDLYQLSYLEGFSLENLVDNINSRPEKSCGDFYDFLNKIEGKQGIKHAYEMFGGIEEKPDFAEVYSRVQSFCMPFIQKTFGIAKWSVKGMVWIL